MADRIAVLIRHGEYQQREGVPSALQPFPLTDEGATQARDCGDQIAHLLEDNGWKLDPILHSSSQLRAWQTADIASRSLRKHGFDVREIRQDDTLSERSLGSAANLTVTEVEAVLEQDPRFHQPPEGWKSNSDYRLPLQGAESLMDAGRRVARHLVAAMTAQPFPKETTLKLFFGHGASFRHAAHALGVLERREIARFSMYHARPLLFCYKADDTWVHCGGSWKSRRLDDSTMD